MRSRLLAVGLSAGLFVGAAFAQSPQRGAGPSHAPAPVIHLKPDPAYTPPAGKPDGDNPTPVQISGSSNVPCYGYARFDLQGSFTSAGWMCFPDRTTGAAVVKTDTFNGGATFLVGGAPGTYDLGAFAQTPGGIATVQTTFVILPPLQPPTPAPGPTPAPTPGPVNPPAPAPTPGPAPLTGNFWAIGVYDLSQLLPASYSDGTIGPAVAGLGGVWLKYGIADTSAAAASWMVAAKKQGAPALVIVASDGSIYSVAAMPPDPASIITAIKTAKGTR